MDLRTWAQNRRLMFLVSEECQQETAGALVGSSLAFRSCRNGGAGVAYRAELGTIFSHQWRLFFSDLFSFDRNYVKNWTDRLRIGSVNSDGCILVKCSNLLISCTACLIGRPLCECVSNEVCQRLVAVLEAAAPSQRMKERENAISYGSLPCE